MIRKLLVLAVLGAALAAASMFPLRKSDAAHSLRLTGAGSAPALPNFDIRLAEKGEFADYDLTSTEGKERATQNAVTRARVSAVERFRSSSKSEAVENLRAVVNEAGALKNFFIDGATLSDPQSDTADNIARNFLNRHNSLFALSASDVANLKLTKEDNDRGTAFLEYFQTIGGIKVFEGQVQVVVNKNGEVLSIREGFLVDSPLLKLKSTLTEAQAIAKAFEYAGRDVAPTLAETYARTSKSEVSRFANPLDLNLEEVLSELNVVRVGDATRLAWHIFAEVGPDEWYEILLDANTGELLLRHNLYVFEAQGTIYVEAPDKGARQLVSFVGDTTINTAAGWMGTSTVTTGNNAEAYLDTDANNAPDNNNGAGLSTGHAFAANQDFTFPFSTTVDPRTQQAAVVTNLFYFNNIMHDFSYATTLTSRRRPTVRDHACSSTCSLLQTQIAIVRWTATSYSTNTGTASPTA